MSAPHLGVLPVVVPLVAAAVLLLIGERSRRAKPLVNVAATVVGLLVAIAILLRVDGGGGEVGVYLAANWRAPFGIVLVADRLSALMVVLTNVVALAVALSAEAGWSRAGVYFHPLFQIQLMGLNGAFLTGDLFNLFVFFEVLLAASYGLQLHGSGFPRVRSGLHYLAVNLLASSLFLVGLSVIYGVVGTLSMADVARKLALVSAADHGLFNAGAAILASAFLIKAAVWPINAWLVPAYSAASAPVAALFALMTKVGFYALLRLSTLLYSAEAGASSTLGRPILLYGGLVTIAFGTLGLLSSLRLVRIACFSVIVSSGTLLAALGVGAVSVTSALLYYLITATLAGAALFLLAEIVERIGTEGPQIPEVDLVPGEDTNLDDEELPLVGRAFPVSIAVLGLAFMACALLVAGLPPLSGFLAKLSLLRAVMRAEPSSASWMILGALLVSGLAAIVALTRAGIRHFWSSAGKAAPHLKNVEAVAVLGLVFVCVALTARAERVMQYTRATAAALHAPRAYIETVLSTTPRPGPTTKTEAP